MLFKKYIKQVKVMLLLFGYRFVRVTKYNCVTLGSNYWE